MHVILVGIIQSLQCECQTCGGLWQHLRCDGVKRFRMITDELPGRDSSPWTVGDGEGSNLTSSKEKNLRVVL